MSAARRLIYSRKALARDYLRAGLGIGGCLLLLVLAGPASPGFWVFAVGTGLFAGFALATVLKHTTCLDIEETAIRRVFCLPLLGAVASQNFDLSNLDGLRLRYFGSRRRRGKGIVELRLRACGQALTADQSLERFEELVGLALSAAERRGLALDAVTSANLGALGYR